MKEMFIFIAIVGLAFASCKKEELIAPYVSDKSTVKDNNEAWKISKKGVVIDGVTSNELTNNHTLQVVYEAVEENDSDNNAKEASWTNSTRTDSNGKLLCDGPYE